MANHRKHTIVEFHRLFLIFHFCWKQFPSTHMHNGCRWSVRCTSDCRCDWVSNQASSKPKTAAEFLTAFSMFICSKQFKPLTVQYDKNGSELLTITNERNGHLDLLCLYAIVLSYIVCMEKTEFDLFNWCHWYRCNEWLSLKVCNPSFSMDCTSDDKNWWVYSDGTIVFEMYSLDLKQR